MKKVFIDGSVGTTGLRIVERLSDRKDLELIRLDEEHRKDSASRRQALNAADVAFLCLPDAAAIEAVEMIENPNTVVIDTSTAHRVSEGWVYGFAELGGRREQLAGAKRIANPGCHASGFLALTAPLVEQGLLSPEEKLSCFSLTGYSGGGKKMIAEYAAEDRNVLLDAPRLYGLSQQHKHMPEMQAYAHLAVPPVFCPIVAPYYAGMEVVVPLFGADKDAICEAYRKYYTNGLVHFVDPADEAGFLSAGAYAGRDDMQITVCGNAERLLLISRFDNLGKGASGAAIQNMNIVLGVPETTGLNLGEE
ncbi:MAG: N-acetyl-gamma-glutamyl-phosphate reductase [Oscillospiraceae bacterium]|nr:N-acetyl-gamma-glutamyl-phosphate reductase [Oscillospiraceae bacterium]MBR2366368.1 N-acetyl-gamma-glutamyl-phosphate reductase [Oscillospiraceae bacterium]MBR2897633.1 N-acetyl-gamma-glutamyl-phosphate reductase [Oscillospiraceae bacterium]MBR2977927.1 N-acetyl-gamma-glutamyl-phosphate reductase [Oscillospiraceae bacterium]MBR3849740.1 N-acetyl-gamma-glutamyl-phosphate reductase [Oscillospiraceae bacterium]